MVLCGDSPGKLGYPVCLEIKKHTSKWLISEREIVMEVFKGFELKELKSFKCFELQENTIYLNLRD